MMMKLRKKREPTKLNDEEEKKKLQTTMTYGLNYYYGLNNRSFLLAFNKAFHFA
jgi:membrane-bound lytic murein transglycosylase B